MTEFLYLLMRDHLPVGIVQIILDEVEKDIATRKTVLYTNIGPAISIAPKRVLTSITPALVVISTGQ